MKVNLWESFRILKSILTAHLNASFKILVYSRDFLSLHNRYCHSIAADEAIYCDTHRWLKSSDMFILRFLQPLRECWSDDWSISIIQIFNSKLSFLYYRSISFKRVHLSLFFNIIYWDHLLQDLELTARHNCFILLFTSISLVAYEWNFGILFSFILRPVIHFYKHTLQTISDWKWTNQNFLLNLLGF